MKNYINNVSDCLISEVNDDTDDFIEYNIYDMIDKKVQPNYGDDGRFITRNILIELRKRYKKRE